MVATGKPSSQRWSWTHGQQTRYWQHRRNQFREMKEWSDGRWQEIKAVSFIASKSLHIKHLMRGKSIYKNHLIFMSLFQVMHMRGTDAGRHAIISWPLKDLDTSLLWLITKIMTHVSFTFYRRSVKRCSTETV